MKLALLLGVVLGFGAAAAAQNQGTSVPLRA